MITTTVNGKNVILYDHINEWLNDNWDLEFLKEFNVDEYYIVVNIGSYIVEETIPINWSIMQDHIPQDMEEEIEYEEIEYKLIGEQDEVPVYVLTENWYESLYLVYFDGGHDTKFKVLCDTYDKAIEWIDNRVKGKVEKLAGDVKNWTPADNVDDLASHLNKIERLCSRYNFLVDLQHYVDVTGLPVSNSFEEKFQSINWCGNGNVFTCDDEGGVLMCNVGFNFSEWYTRDLDDLIKERLCEEEDEA